MSSVPIAGPCSVCGKHTHKKCSICGKIYCSAACQKQDWPQHEALCQPSHRGTSQPTDDDLDRGRKKAQVKLAVFEHQLRDFRRGKHDAPTIRVGTHHDLLRVMGIEWLAEMNAWEEKATEELMQHLANGGVEFVVTRIGAIIAEVVLNAKLTRIQLYLPHKERSREWTIVMEPLAYSPHEPFWDEGQKLEASSDHGKKNSWLLLWIALYE